MKKISFEIQVMVLASLAVLLILSLCLSPFLTSTSKVFRQDSTSVFGSSLKSSLVNQIILSQKSTQVSLSKEKDVWNISYPQKPFPANQTTVADFLSGMKELKTGRLVEKKSKDFALYGLDEESAIRIELQDVKDNSFILYVGKEDSSYQRRFIRFEKGESIYETKIPASFVHLQNKEWADLKLFPSVDSQSNNPVQISVVGKDPFQKADSPLVLNYQLVLQADSEDAKKMEWKLVDSEEKVSPYEVEQVIRKLSTATGYDFSFQEDWSALGLKSPMASLSVTLSSGLIHSLSIGKKVEGVDRYYCLLSPLNEVMEVSQATLESLLKSRNHFQTN